MNNDYIVELDNVYKTYFTRHFFQKDRDTGLRRLYGKQVVHAAHQVAFGIQRGEIFGLLGPNGAGKTTSVKMISGLVRPSAGRVFVDGLHVEKKRLKVLRKIGVVLEGTRTSIWPLTPLENLSYFGNLKDVKGRVLKQRAHELLEFIGLGDKKNIQVRKLSRGERQKLAICIALIADPPVLLLDEPTTGLDVHISRTIKDRILEMAHEQGKCMLVTTHDMHVAQELCDRIGIINKGRLIACRPTEDMLEVFAEHVYEFRVDREPPLETLERIPGVLSVDAKPGDDGAVCVVRFDQNPRLRSDALFAIMNSLHERGFMLHGVSQRQQTLENVFLRLTANEE